MICMYSENYTAHKKAKPKPRLIVPGFSWRRRPRFNPSLVCVDFVVHEVKCFLPVPRFLPVSAIPPMLHTHSSTTSAIGVILATDNIVK